MTGEVKENQSLRLTDVRQLRVVGAIVGPFYALPVPRSFGIEQLYIDEIAFVILYLFEYFKLYIKEGILKMG